MPIECPIEIAKLLTEEFGKLDYVAMRHVFDSKNCLGRLADERIYQADVSLRLTQCGFHVSRGVPNNSQSVIEQQIFSYLHLPTLFFARRLDPFCRPP